MWKGTERGTVTAASGPEKPLTPLSLNNGIDLGKPEPGRQNCSVSKFRSPRLRGSKAEINIFFLRVLRVQQPIHSAILTIGLSHSEFVIFFFQSMDEELSACDDLFHLLDQ